MVAALSGETRWTAILSTDMVDFTQITQSIGNEKVYDLLQHVLGIARDVVDAHGGHIIDTAGDGILAAFGAPKALENASVQGCAAAHAFRKRINADGPSLQARFGITPRFRTGLAGGNAMIAVQDDASIKVVGDPVNQAARLQALAGPDEVLLTDSIRREAEGFVATTDRGPQTIKGFKTPVHVHALAEMLEAVTRFEGTRRRGIVTFVSRQAEMTQALSTLQSEPAQLLMVVGVPGIGKSRLTHEIMRRLPTNTPIYIGQCAPTGQTPFAPVYDILRQASGTQGPPEEVLQSLAHMCDADALASVLAPNDGNTDTLQKAVQERTLLAELLRALHAQTGAVFVIEDMHWVDSGTSGLIDALVKTPLPVLMTARPTFRPKWQDSTGVSTIELAPLNETAIREIVQTRFDKAAAPALANLIAAKSEGIPLIAEEITRALQHGNQLIDTDAGLDLAGDDAKLVSGNLEHMVLARVDRLPKAQKTQLQIAAAIGRDFAGKVLQKACDTSEPLTDLEGLIAPLGGDKWQFSHALIRDAVYDSLLSGQREAVHGQIAKALENQQGSPNNAALADHFSKANNPSKAVHYILAAARESLNAYALADVDTFMEQAMTFLEQDDSLIDSASFGELVLIWVRATDQLGSFGKVLAIRERTRPQLVRLGRVHETALLDALGAIAMTHVPDYRESEALALTTLERAKAEGDDVAAAWAKVALMRVYEETYWKPPEYTLNLADEIAPVAAAAGDNHLAMVALYQKASIYRSSGGRHKSLEVAQEIARFSDEHNDRRGRSYSVWVRAFVYTSEGSYDKAYDIIMAGRDDVIPGSSDEYVTNMITLFCRLFREPPLSLVAELNETKATNLARPDMNLVNVCDLALVIVAFKSGQLAKGWGQLKDIIPKLRTYGHVTFLRHFLNLRAEAMLSLVGLVDPEAETPSRNGEHPRQKPGLADMATFAMIRLRWKRLAMADLEEVLALDPANRGVQFVRAKIGMGLIAQSRGQKSAAAALLQEGLQGAEEEGLDILKGRAERALTTLGIDVSQS